jgi:hypothetical protein
MQAFSVSVLRREDARGAQFSHTLQDSPSDSREIKHKAGRQKWWEAVDDFSPQPYASIDGRARMNDRKKHEVINRGTLQHFSSRVITYEGVMGQEVQDFRTIHLCQESHAF